MWGLGVCECEWSVFSECGGMLGLRVVCKGISSVRSCVFFWRLGIEFLFESRVFVEN